MAYYTGILFEGFVQGLGFAVTSGGRYDNLIAHFGHSYSGGRFCYRCRTRDDVAEARSQKPTSRPT